MAEGLDSRQGSPITKTILVDPVENLIREVRGKVGQEIRVDQKSSGQANKLDEILSNGHYIINAREEI